MSGHALRPRVAIIGVGNMGAAMAQRLLEQGWPVQVCDLELAKVQNLVSFGALALANPASVAMNTIVTVVCVVDDEQTESVLFGSAGLAPALSPGQAVMLCPTLSPRATEDCARRLAQRGIDVIDAPMSGGPARARAGSMSLMVACEAAVFERHRALLETLSDKLFRISERPGDGARTKLVNNLLAAINLVGAAEVMVMAQNLGLDPLRTLEVIEHSSGQSWIGSDRMRRALAGDHAARAHMSLLRKDTRLAIEAARVVGAVGPLGPVARDVFAQASAAGLEGFDDSALLQWLGTPRMPG